VGARRSVPGVVPSQKENDWLACLTNGRWGQDANNVTT